MHVVGVARTDQRVLREAKALAGAGYDITIVDIVGNPQAPQEEDFQGIHLRHIIMPSRYQRTRFKPYFLVKVARLTRAATRVMSRIPADVYHAHDSDALLACYAAARQRHKPLVFDAHEIPYSDPHTARYRLITRAAVQRLRQILPHCAAVIAVSDPDSVYIQEHYGGPRAAIVRNAPPYLPPVASANHLRERLSLPPTARIALYQGGIQENRGLSRLIHAAKYLPSGNYIVLMGNGPSVQSLEALIAREGVGERVKLIPSVPYDELQAWTASADLGLIVYPLDYSVNVLYCLPNKLFEFLMAGLPVLCSELPAVSAVLREHDAGHIVASLEPKDVAEAIAELLADAPARERMRRNALDAAHELCWEIEQRRLLDVYAHLPGVAAPNRPTSASVPPGERGAGSVGE